MRDVDPERLSRSFALPSRCLEFPRTGLSQRLTDDDVTMESVQSLIGSGHFLVMISCVFNTKQGAFQREVHFTPCF
jgi:hypothetical protein